MTRRTAPFYHFADKIIGASAVPTAHANFVCWEINPDRVKNLAGTPSQESECGHEANQESDVSRVRMCALARFGRAELEMSPEWKVLVATLPMGDTTGHTGPLIPVP